ncbi:hypothetical protein E2C01_053883 [Portunus trituberculatus]|uniref:Uncharacterized protein n=1 Tax=Portunus trituberculatus TaxID=210409 RepID=A0A5B7GR89_PORTR|nr:hypothetical protein [Portunus trituberculatus]
MPKRLENYWERGKAVYRSAMTHTVTYKLDVGTSRRRSIIYIACELLWRKDTSHGANRDPPSSPNSEVRSDNEVVGDGGTKQCCGVCCGVCESLEEEAWNEPCVSRSLRMRNKPQWWTVYRQG